MAERFTILLPVARPPALLPFAVESVLGQSHSDFELFIVSDGAPQATVGWANEAASRDSRITVFDFPKGERHGEQHRHIALQQATGSLVAHICDDDLWFPDFLTELAQLLGTVDFGNLLHVGLGPDGGLVVIPGDLSDSEMRRRMMEERCNLFGPTVCGYRMSAYWRLPIGWSPAPEDIWTDLHMWRKFFARNDILCGTRHVVQAVALPDPLRSHMSLDERASENRTVAERLRDPAERDAFAKRALAALTQAGEAKEEGRDEPSVARPVRRLGALAHYLPLHRIPKKRR